MTSLQNSPKPTLTPTFILGTLGITSLATLVLMALAGMMTGSVGYYPGYNQVALAIHLATVIPALFLGAWMIATPKGTRLHKMLGRIWAALMMTTAIASFGLTGITGGLSPIHIFSVITLVSIPRAIIAVRKGNMIAHQRAMMGPYIGLVVAGLFSFWPGRMMANLLSALF